MMPTSVPVARLCVALCVFGWSELAAGQEESALRVATYNSSLFRNETGELVRDLEPGDDAQARRIAEVIQRVRPDVLLVNEFDYDRAGRAAELFCAKYLAVGQNGGEPIDYPHRFIAPVNTGRPSGLDLDHNGRPGEPADAVGFGRHEGQYGMLVLSRWPIDREHVRTFQNFLWRDMPGAMLPTDPNSGKPYYSGAEMAVLRLSSKSFWDVPIRVPTSDGGEPVVIHLLPSHPTPPVFDGPEDRNGCRNHDEVRLLADYIDPAKSGYLADDDGRAGGLDQNALFVIVGDLNADPVDGQSVAGTMAQLLDHSRVNTSFTPTSVGGQAAAAGTAADPPHRGDPAHDTAKFGDDGAFNLRVDYVLPSHGLKVVNGAVFWPAPNEPGAEAITATDHRLVWVDIDVE